jgi:DnaK suppressor protein
MKSEQRRRYLLKEKKRLMTHLLAEKSEEERDGDSWSEPHDLEDWASISVSQDIKLKLANRDLSQLMEIERALKKFKMRKYGVCERCGRRIEVERLDLIPWTRYCVDCVKKVGGETKE